MDKPFAIPSIADFGCRADWNEARLDAIEAHLVAQSQPAKVEAVREDVAREDFARKLVADVLTANRMEGSIAALNTLRTGLQAYVAGLVVPDGEVPGIGPWTGEWFSEEFRTRGFSFIRTPKEEQ
jgi:hypothetical protein